MLKKYQYKGARIIKGQIFNRLRVVIAEQLEQLLARTSNRKGKENLLKLYQAFKKGTTNLPTAKNIQRLGEDIYNEIATTLAKDFGYDDSLNDDGIKVGSIKTINLTAKDEGITVPKSTLRPSRIISSTRLLLISKVITILKDKDTNNEDVDEELLVKKRRTRIDTKEERGTVLGSTYKGSAVNNKTIQKLNNFKKYLNIASIKKFGDLPTLRQLKDRILRLINTIEFTKNKKKFNKDLAKAQKKKR